MPCAVIFCLSLSLRFFFFTGFILGDDAMEVGACQHVLEHGPNFNDQVQLRFGIWIFNIPFIKLFDLSETSFFLPTWLMSASLGVFAYWVLLLHSCTRSEAFWAGLFVASAPFEILIGVVRANDLIFSWLVMGGFLSWIYFHGKPVLRGCLLAYFLWLAFWTKLWVVYYFPGLGIYYLHRVWKRRNFAEPIAFSLCTLLLHGVIALLTKLAIGQYFPFIENHAASYPFDRSQLTWLFLVYPKLVFFGSELGTTLFGAIPYLMVGGLTYKVVCSVLKRQSCFDSLDWQLIYLYLGFFVWLNFFPNSFVFDQYYSAPRIFRYLAPISFPMTLHVAKMIIDLSYRFRVRQDSQWWQDKTGIVSIFSALILINIIQAQEATRPGRDYRQALLPIVEDLKQLQPPQLWVDNWMGFFLKIVYLNELAHNTSYITAPYQVRDFEAWLDKNEGRRVNGAVLITGIASYVHYGCHDCGYRLSRFKKPLDPRWQLMRDYRVQGYLPQPEAARLWVWRDSPGGQS